MTARRGLGSGTPVPRQGRWPTAEELDARQPSLCWQAARCVDPNATCAFDSCSTGSSKGRRPGAPTLTPLRGGRCLAGSPAGASREGRADQKSLFKKEPLADVQRALVAPLNSLIFKMSRRFNDPRQSFRFSSVALAAGLMMCSSTGAATAGSLTGSFTTGATSNVSLSAAGITEWAVWGQGTSTSLAPTDKSLGMTGISNLTAISNGNPLRALGQYNNYGESTFAWTNGTVSPTASNVFSGIQNLNTPGSPLGLGEGFYFTVPASTIAGQLTLFTTVHFGKAQLVATLLDGSAPPLIIDTTKIFENLATTFNINYQANSDTSLTLKFLLTEEIVDDSNVAIQGVSTTYTPVPGPLPVLGVAYAFSMSRRLRRRITAKPDTL